MMMKKIAMMIMTTTMVDDDSNHCNGDKCDGDLMIMTFELGGPLPYDSENQRICYNIFKNETKNVLKTTKTTHKLTRQEAYVQEVFDKQSLH